MPTFTKTFLFASNAEGLVYNGGTAASGTWLSTDSATAGGGCIRIRMTSKSLQVSWGMTQSTAEGGTPQTWEGWGAPASSYIQSVQLLSWKYKIAANTKMIPPLDVTFQVGSFTMHSSGAIPTTSITGWLTGATGAVTPIFPDTPSTNNAVLQMFGWITTTGGGGTADADFRLDEISIEVTYTTSPSGGAFTPSDPMGTMGIFGI